MTSNQVYMINKMSQLHKITINPGYKKDEILVISENKKQKVNLYYLIAKNGYTSLIGEVPISKGI